MNKVKGSIIKNTLSNQVSEVAADLFAGFFMIKRFGVIKSLQAGFLFSMIGTLCLFFLWNDISLLPVFILIAKFGVSANFNIVYIASVGLIPPMFAASVWGINNTAGRLSTMLAPQVSELAYPIPLIVILVCCTIGIFVSQILVTKLPKFE